MGFYSGLLVYARAIEGANNELAELFGNILF
jgi:hypothetical protein